MIEVKNLAKNYGNKQALTGISFEIRKGEICGYIGPNGAGKSTTVKILTGILKPDAGEVAIAGIDVGQNPERVKPLIGYVPETGGVFESLSGREFLAFAGRLYGLREDVIRERSELLLEYFGLLGSADNFMTTYSKGMKQKVVLSTAVLHSPEVFLFDEPLDGLDAHATVLFKELIHHLALRGRTVLYCSHLLDIVERVCHRMIILRNGSIVGQGSIGELRDLTNQDTLEEAFSILTESEDAEEKTERLLNNLDAVTV